ncbi:MAG: HAD-IIB family hydrolase [Myxococcota bacterium]
MQALHQLSAQVCRKIQYVFCDIDDTLTLDGRLLEESYSALWRAHRSGYKLIPITGRPAGWVDQIARLWPVDAVVGENGGFYAWMSPTGLKTRYIQDEETRRQNRVRLDHLQAQILKQIPGTALASDQSFRHLDLAIDFCEDVPPLPQSSVQHIVQLFEQAGAAAKVSSIHVNGWFGDHDKLTTCQLLAQEQLGLDAETLREHSIFCGDSPNDEPMFRWFPHSIGVANVNHFLAQMQYHPAYVTPSEGGLGFAELIEHLCTNASH